MPAIFGEHMVLQHGVTLPIWGWADPGEHVMVSFADRYEETVADSHGNWRVTLRPLLKCEEPTILVINGNNRIEIDDVIVGDVWICAGEGNMSFPLSDAASGVGNRESLKDRELRFFVMEKHAARSPDHHGEGHWSVCTPESAPGFSAIGYFFARDIRSSQHLPIGMIQCAWEETPAQAWISLPGLSKSPSFVSYLGDFFQEKHSSDFKNQPKDLPSGLYNGMIAPLIPYAMTGVIWYQGESNEGKGSLQYRRLLPRLIRDWREQWGQGPFPFFFISLAGFGENDESPVEESPRSGAAAGKTWPWIREGMESTLTLPFTGMAVASDLGVSGERQPPDKLDAARRLALLARHRVYGEKLTDSGPVYHGMTLEGEKIRIRFGSVGSGLTLGLSPWESDAITPSLSTHLRGFAISGDDRKWYPANATIEGDTVLLSSEAIHRPVAVRYNWKGFPKGNLYNKEGLPAAPFRTDSDQP